MGLWKLGFCQTTVMLFLHEHVHLLCHANFSDSCYVFLDFQHLVENGSSPPAGAKVPEHTQSPCNFRARCLNLLIPQIHFSGFLFLSFFAPSTDCFLVLLFYFLMHLALLSSLLVFSNRCSLVLCWLIQKVLSNS